MTVINTTTHDHIQIISLNRPEAYNALDITLLKQLTLALELASKPTIRAVLLRGEGKAFCSGGDIKSFKQELEKGFISLEMPQLLHRCITQIRELAKPVIASVQGACAGAGMSLALACDLTIAAEDTYFTLAYSNLGLSADGGSTYFLPRLLGIKKALELYFLSPRINAEEALSLGLINQIIPNLDLENYSISFAKKLALGPTLAFAKTKALINKSSEHNLNTQLDLETLGVAEISKTQDFKEGVNAFNEKRMPRFLGIG
jgi:2-(1,2-epoxy-1,2-dihydrophenyl)acetyl-CoA isomerase